ncbi:MAG: 50S ribosomal protein L30 [Bacteroidales bacterium]|jgi:large subunit ribosomal protein L30|nr:50S ribosomal protein L30 [Bacteroidales bacterium]MDD4544948.1 50S ribosomal protein L30 [Bacteroidales bacterium]MDY0053358.1 50S ribosomal protein L30 [Bacteroidales bacterium]
MKIKVTQVKSAIGKTLRQKQTLASLGLGRINQSRDHELTPQINGMIEKVKHLIKIEEI